jgi:hypothetical protein
MEDFNYIQDGFFVSLIPNNIQASEIYNQIWNELNGKVPIKVWPNIRSQLKKAGYTVRKAKAVSITEQNVILNSDPLGLLD